MRSQPAAQDGCSFYKDFGLLNDFGGVVITTGEGNSVADSIGSGKGSLLRNHGLITVGKTIDAAVGSSAHSDSSDGFSEVSLADRFDPRRMVHFG